MSDSHEDRDGGANSRTTTCKVYHFHDGTNDGVNTAIPSMVAATTTTPLTSETPIALTQLVVHRPPKLSIIVALVVEAKIRPRPLRLRNLLLGLNMDLTLRGKDKEARE
ncbi:hypothetical protein Sjap_003297 [Stephania japonica]|uniref:Uncharacterized protein n=1 Tax=Stephania japonica TaxID=461633 RepID=A0AAP0KNG8_9MAGN